MEENRRATINHHKRLVQAIAAQDAKTARATVESLLKLAIKAFKRYLQLAPDSSDAPLIRRELKQLTKT